MFKLPPLVGGELNQFFNLDLVVSNLKKLGCHNKTYGVVENANLG